MRELSWYIDGWNDYIYWQKIDKQLVKKINRLIKDAIRKPFTGIGKPKPLVGNYAGCWSRRVSKEHRLIYTVDDQKISILSCRFHY